jgi:putative oxygen-independent coproporphyrinogen III oxidase
MDFPSAANRALGFYLHVPYCTTRCGYCDFNTYTNVEFEPGVSRSTWVDTANREIDIARKSLVGAPEISTVFFGGGTPTLLPAADLVKALQKLKSEFGMAEDAEITTEANPDSVDRDYLEELKAGGFNRISFGMQSAVSHVLDVLDRTHTPGKAAEVVQTATEVGFSHINLDLIYGSPGESLADLTQSLDSVIGTSVDHISAYALTLETGTKMAAQVKRGELTMPDDELLAEMYALIDDSLSAQGFEWYEVSNWAKPNGHCQHNLNYWQNQNWWGVGPGAHSHVNGMRWWNVKHPSAWTAQVLSAKVPVADSENLTSTEIDLENLMLGIRLKTGIAARDFQPQLIRDLLSDGLLDPEAEAAGTLRLTRKGRLLADVVIRTLSA